MAKTYEIPTANGGVSAPITAASKAAAVAQVPNASLKPISVAGLSGAAPYNVPPANTAPTTDGLSMTNGSTYSQVKADATYEPPQNTAKDQLAETLKSITAGIGGQDDAENKIRNDQQLYEKKQRATAVSTQLDQMDKDYRDQVQTIKQAAGGLTGGAQAEIAALTNKYENNRANVALTYKVFAEDYNGALQIVNDKVQSLQNQHAQQIQAYQLAASAVQNDLTESEKLIVQANLTKRQNEAKTVQDAYAAALNRAIQNGAPASVLSTIDAASRAPGATAATIAAAAGQYGVQRDLQFVSGTDNQAAGYFNKTTGEFTPTGGGGNGGSGGGASSDGKFAATIDLAAQTGTTNQQRAQIKQNIQNFIAQGDYKSAYAAISQATKNGLTGAAATNFQQQQNSLGVLADLKTAIQAYADAGGNTNIFKGTQDNIQTKIGQLSTDPKYAALATQLTAAFQQYRLQMTGAAFGVKESAEYASILPDKSNSLDLNLAKLSGAHAYLDSSVKSSVRSVVGDGGVYIKEYADGAQSQTPTAPADNEFTSWLKANGLPLLP